MANDPKQRPDILGTDHDKEVLRQCMERLTSRDQEILTLRHWQDLPYKEIARTLDIPEGTVMSRVFHARKRLRELLEQETRKEESSRRVQVVLHLEVPNDLTDEEKSRIAAEVARAVSDRNEELGGARLRLARSETWAVEEVEA